MAEISVRSPMKANPGGQLPPEDVVGRDGDIDRLWEILGNQGIVLTAERRMGKTTIIKLMANNPRSNRFTVYRDVSSVASPAEFVSNVLTDISKYSGGFKGIERVLRNWTKKLAGWQIGNIIKIPESSADRWKEILEDAISHLMENKLGDDGWADELKPKQIIFFWDEFPFMLDKFLNREGGKLVAMEMLDILRALRQTYPQLKMVYTGSIGLHHVINKLKQAGYNNAPTNDMYEYDLNPLVEDDAIDLASRLLAGEEITTADRLLVATEIAQQVDRFPYYIHYLISDLKGLKQEISPELVTQQIDKALCKTNPWQMDHYQDRIKTYYDEAIRRDTRAILNTLAVADVGLSLQEIHDRNPAIRELETLQDIIKLLRQDGYLELNPDRTYSFRYGLIKRYWRYQC